MQSIQHNWQSAKIQNQTGEIMMAVISTKKYLKKIAEQQRKNASNGEQKYIEVVKYTIGERN